MGDVLNLPKPDIPDSFMDSDLTLKPGDLKPEEGAPKVGRRISWHQGQRFLDEFDDSHLWQHGKGCSKVSKVGSQGKLKVCRS